jgi:hypothetical protein
MTTPPNSMAPEYEGWPTAPRTPRPGISGILFSAQPVKIKNSAK